MMNVQIALAILAAFAFRYSTVQGSLSTIEGLAWIALIAWATRSLMIGQVMTEKREDKVHLQLYPSGAFGLRYEYPRKFHSYKIVYDPTIFDFQSYKVLVKDKLKYSNSDTMTSKGGRLPSEPDKFVIEGFTRNGAPSSYDPKGQTQVVFIEVQFMPSARLTKAEIVDRVTRGVQCRKYTSTSTFTAVPFGDGFSS
jgi:hypothetical protein